MKRLFYRTSFAALLLVAACVQNELAQVNGRRVLNPDDVPLDVERLENFIPAGWKIKAQAAGDLNGDRQQDAVLALAFGNGKETALIVGFKNSVGGYTLAALAPDALRCDDCGSMLGDGTPQVEIKNGQIHLKGFSGSRETREITMRFRFDARKKRFALIGDDYQTTDRLELETLIISSNYLTNQRIYTEIVEDKKDKKTQRRISPPLPTVYLDKLVYEDYWEKFERDLRFPIDTKVKN